MNFSFPRVVLALAAFCLGICIAGCGTPSFLVTPVSSSSELQEIQVQPGKGLFAPKIALIEVDGMLLNGKAGGFLQASENPLSLFTQQLQQAADDASVKAVVLRINSPGGAVATSDTMYAEVKKFRSDTGKPVIAAAQEVDASGAYYLSCACDKIVVHPAGIIGSIGVIFEDFDISGTLYKIGVEPNTIKSAEFKDIGSPFKHMTDRERVVLQAMVDHFYARFKGIVSDNRPIKTPEALAKVDDGRVFTSDDALALGLVDQVGRLDDAIDLAKTMSNTPSAQIVMYKRPYGYSGSIYADTSAPEPRSNVTTLALPDSQTLLPGGFYYLWEP
jgi:protease IV